MRPDICDYFRNLAWCPFTPIRFPKAMTVPALVLEVKLRFKKTGSARMQSVKAEVNGITELAHLERMENNRIKEIPHTFSVEDCKSIRQKWTEFLLTANRI
jgi:hypothetical protein